MKNPSLTILPHLTPNKHDTSEDDSEEMSDSDEECNINDLRDQGSLSTHMEHLKPFEYNNINIGQWVKVMYEEELLIRKLEVKPLHNVLRSLLGLESLNTLGGRMIQSIPKMYIKRMFSCKKLDVVGSI